MARDVPFEGERPDVKNGDEVECRTASADWVRKTARSSPRYDRDNALGGCCYLTVAVSEPGDDDWVNWLAVDVRRAAPTSREADR